MRDSMIRVFSLFAMLCISLILGAFCGGIIYGIFYLIGAKTFGIILGVIIWVIAAIFMFIYGLDGDL